MCEYFAMLWSCLEFVIGGLFCWCLGSNKLKLGFCVATCCCSLRLLELKNESFSSCNCIGHWVDGVGVRGYWKLRFWVAFESETALSRCFDRPSAEQRAPDRSVVEDHLTNLLTDWFNWDHPELKNQGIFNGLRLFRV